MPYLMRKRCNTFPLRSEIRQESLLSPLTKLRAKNINFIIEGNFLMLCPQYLEQPLVYSSYLTFLSEKYINKC